MIKDILLIDDDSSILEILKDKLEEYGISPDNLHLAQDPLTALETFNRFKDNISVIISDHYMPIQSGSELCEILKGSKPSLYTIILTGELKLKESDLPYVDKLLYKPEGVREIPGILDQIQHKKVQKFTRKHDRTAYGPYEFAQIFTQSNKATFGIVISQSDGGCALAVQTSSGPKVGDECQVALGRYNEMSFSFESNKRVHAQIVWLKIVDNELLKVGIKYL